MRGIRMFRLMKMVAGGAILLQFAGCTFADFNEVLQTALLGVTAAGSIAIIQNI